MTVLRKSGFLSGKSLFFVKSKYKVGEVLCWRKLKQRLKVEGNETVTNCHGLKLISADGKMRPY